MLFLLRPFFKNEVIHCQIFNLQIEKKVHLGAKFSFSTRNFLSSNMTRFLNWRHSKSFLEKIKNECTALKKGKWNHAIILNFESKLIDEIFKILSLKECVASLNMTIQNHFQYILPKILIAVIAWISHFTLFRQKNYQRGPYLSTLFFFEIMTFSYLIWSYGLFSLPYSFRLEPFQIHKIQPFTEDISHYPNKGNELIFFSFFLFWLGSLIAFYTASLYNHIQQNQI